jgi:hypothetical protein
LGRERKIKGIKDEFKLNALKILLTKDEQIKNRGLEYFNKFFNEDGNKLNVLGLVDIKQST